MPTLQDLKARFVSIVETKAPSPTTMKYTVYSFQKSMGMQFLCPACYEHKTSLQDVHPVTCYFVGTRVPAELAPVQYVAAGTSLEDISLSQKVVFTECGGSVYSISNGGIMKVSN